MIKDVRRNIKPIGRSIKNWFPIKLFRGFIERGNYFNKKRRRNSPAPHL
jgi:hypothetical protein